MEKDQKAHTHTHTHARARASTTNHITRVHTRTQHTHTQTQIDREREGGTSISCMATSSRSSPFLTPEYWHVLISILLTAQGVTRFYTAISPSFACVHPRDKNDPKIFGKVRKAPGKYWSRRHRSSRKARAQFLKVGRFLRVAFK